MEIKKEKIADVLIFSITGRVTAIKTDLLKKNIIPSINGGELNVLLDLSQLDYINSRGLGIFLGAAKIMDDQKGRIAFCCLRENIREIFEIAGLDKIFHVYETREQAIETFRVVRL